MLEAVALTMPPLHMDICHTGMYDINHIMINLNASDLNVPVSRYLDLNYPAKVFFKLYNDSSVSVNLTP